MVFSLPYYLSVAACQNDNADVGVIVSRPHVFADLGNGAVFFGSINQGVQAFRMVEFDPYDAVVLRFVE